MRTEYDDVIRAWLDGAEVEQRHPCVKKGKWHQFDGVLAVSSDTIFWQYRIAKPAKEPKYLWVYQNEYGNVSIYHLPVETVEPYLGKIRLEE